MALFKFEIPNPRPDMSQGGFVGQVTLRPGSSKSLVGVQASLGSGDGTFNLTTGEVDPLLDFDDLGFDLNWHFRPEDLSLTYSNGSAVTSFYDYSYSNARLTSSNGPAYRTGATNNSSEALQFQDAQSQTTANHLEDDTGNFSFDGDQDLTLACYIDDVDTSSNHFPIFGSKSQSGTYTGLYGKWFFGHILRNDNNASVSNGNVDIGDDQVRVVTIENNSATQNRVHDYVNGTVNNINNDPMTIASGHTQTFDLIGSTYRYYRSTDTWSSMDGMMGEFMCFNGKLDTDARQKVEGYLAHKYGAEGNLPSAHPYKSTDPTVNPGTFLITTQTLGTSYFTQQSLSGVTGKYYKLNLFMPKAQNPSNLVLVVETS